jgi:glycerophosphoryl diester phosphodiesterase
MTTRKFYILAHRGDQQKQIENTPNAFKSMARFNDMLMNSSETNFSEINSSHILGVEFDIQLIDDQLVCYHDDSFYRLHHEFKDIALNVNTINEINKLDSYPSIPLFEDILKIFTDKSMNQNYFLNIELKSYEISLIEKVIDLVKKYQVTNRVLLSSFSGTVVEYISIYHPEFCTGFLVGAVENTAFEIRNNSWIKNITYLIFNVKSLLESDGSVLEKLPNKLGVYTLDNESYVTSEELFNVIESHPQLDLLITDNMDLTIRNIPK